MSNFISPPVTPKQSLTSHFYELQPSSMILPPSPPIRPYYLHQPYYNKRKVVKPKRSLISNTEGIFSMPMISKITTERNTKLPRIDVASLLNQEEETVKKSQTHAAATYDSLTADTDPHILFKDAQEWIPSYEVFNKRPIVRVSWKGSPLKIKTMPYIEKLHPSEITIASTLRLTPEQYLKCKWALVLAAKEAFETGQLFRKSEAQKVCCIDVNKTSVLWQAFGKLGWLGKKWPQ